MTRVFQNISNGILNSCIDELNKPENKEQIQLNILDPMMNYIIDKLKPYIWTVSMVSTIIILLMIAILITFMQKRKLMLT